MLHLSSLSFIYHKTIASAASCPPLFMKQGYHIVAGFLTFSLTEMRTEVYENSIFIFCLIYFAVAGAVVSHKNS